MPDDLDARPKSHLSKAELEAMPEAHIQHPLNTASDVYLKRLAPTFGLKRLALYIARVPPAKESLVYHRHERDEEFLIILSGHGRAEIGDATIDVGPGDIMAFPAPDGPPHDLTNPFKEDLVYLMGGESSGLDVAHLPRNGMHLVFSASGIWGFSNDQSEVLSFADWSVDEEEPSGRTAIALGRSWLDADL